MKILFLDIDGVLNSRDSFERYQPDTPYHVDPHACRRLKLLLDDIPDLNIVISSTWRKYLDLEKMRMLLKQFRIEPNRTIGYTPNTIRECIRGHEIHLWLENHPEITSFAIVDDNDDMGKYLNKLVQTDARIGLVDSDILRLKELLK